MHLCRLSKWSTAFYLAPMFSSHHSRAQTHRVEVKTAMHTRNFRTWFFFLNSLGLNHTLQPPLHTCNQQKKHIFTGSSRLLQLLQQHVLWATCTSCILDPAIAAIAACPIDPHFHGYIINVFGILKGEYNTIQGAVQWPMAYNLKPCTGSAKQCNDCSQTPTLILCFSTYSAGLQNQVLPQVQWCISTHWQLQLQRMFG